MVLLGMLTVGAAYGQQSPAPANPEPAIEAHPRLIEELFDCVRPELPRDWVRAWIVITSVGSYDTYLAELFFATTAADSKGKPLPTPCDAPHFSDLVRFLNTHLTPAQKKWHTARIQFARDGKFEIRFDNR